MICIQVQGGIGNQLFQCAFGQVLSKFYNTEVVYDIGTYHPLSSFNIMARLGFFTPRQFELGRLINDIKITSLGDKIKLKSTILHKIFYHIIKKRPKNHKSENTGYVYDKSWFELDDPLKNNYYCSGTWNVAKYFEGSEKINIKLSSESECLKYFTTNINIDNEVKADSISVHIRRGDYAKLGLVVCDEDYYNKGLKYICDKIGHENVTLYIFSDDPDWVIENMRCFEKYPNTKYVDKGAEEVGNMNDVESLVLMSRCKHHIIANSTYSRRGAFLSTLGGITVAPKNWMKNISSDPVVPENWVKI